MNKLNNYILKNLESKEEYSNVKNYIFELLSFGYKQGISCLFPAYIFILLFLTSKFNGAFLPRYDMLLIACIIAQIVLYVLRLENKREILVICLFHGLGLLLEWHKVNVGSWTYPEDAYTKIFNVPLYSGFMYSSVASYILMAWRNFDLQLANWPNRSLVLGIGLLIYLNFFTNSFLPDLRISIGVATFIVFWRTKVYYTPNKRRRSMPMTLSFVLIGFFIWLAENIATSLGAWKYTYQHEGWQMVDLHKISSWSLLVIVSVILIAQLKLTKYPEVGELI